MYLLKVFYLGEPYSGFQRQPGGNTVENLLEDTMVEMGLIRSFKDAAYQSASRTDSGVNAIGNVIALELENIPRLQQINSALSRDGSIYLWAWTEVQSGYKLRPTKGKIYEYNIPHIAPEFTERFDRIKEFEGAHDFSAFIKKDKVERPTKCTIKRIDHYVREEGITISIMGDHFGWEMIRRMIGFLMDRRYLDKHPSEYLDKGGVMIPVHPAPARFLTLKRVFLRDELNWNVVDVSRRLSKFQRIKSDKIDLLSTQIMQYQSLKGELRKQE